MINSLTNLTRGQYTYMYRIYAKKQNMYVYKIGHQGICETKSLQQRSQELSYEFGSCIEKEEQNVLLLLLAKTEGLFDENRCHKIFGKYSLNVTKINGSNSRECYEISFESYNEIKKYFNDFFDVIHEETNYDINKDNVEFYNNTVLSRTYFDSEDKAMDEEDDEDIRSDDGSDDGSDLENFIEDDLNSVLESCDSASTCSNYCDDYDNYDNFNESEIIYENPKKKMRLN